MLHRHVPTFLTDRQVDHAQHTPGPSPAGRRSDVNNGGIESPPTLHRVESRETRVGRLATGFSQEAGTYHVGLGFVVFHSHRHEIRRVSDTNLR